MDAEKVLPSCAPELYTKLNEIKAGGACDCEAGLLEIVNFAWPLLCAIGCNAAGSYTLGEHRDPLFRRHCGDPQWALERSRDEWGFLGDS